MLEIFQFIAICLACFSFGFSLSNFLNQRIHRSADKIIDLQKAEIERLKEAYKQVSWERDIFVEDMNEEIKKDCSYLMLDIKTIKAEAIKEFAERLKEDFIGFSRPNNLVAIRDSIDNLVKEMVGDV